MSAYTIRSDELIGGVVLTGTHGAVDLIGDATWAITVSLGNPPADGVPMALFECCGLHIEALYESSTTWRVRAKTFIASGGSITTTSSAPLDLDTRYELRVTHDVDAQEVNVYVDGDLVATGVAGQRLTGGTGYIMSLPAASWFTSAAVWSSVIAPPATPLFTGGEISYCGSDVIHTFTTDEFGTSETFTLDPVGTLPPGGVDVHVLVVGAGKGWDTTAENSVGGAGGDVVQATVNVTGAVTVKVPGIWGRAAASPGNAEFGAIVATSGGANGNAAGATLTNGNFANYRNTAWGGGPGAGGDGEDGVANPDPTMGALRGGSGGPGFYSAIPCTPGYFGAGGAGGGNDGVDSTGGGGFNNGPMERGQPGLGATKHGGVHKIAGGGVAADDSSGMNYGEGVPGGWVSDSNPNPPQYGRGGPGIVIARYTP